MSVLFPSFATAMSLALLFATSATAATVSIATDEADTVRTMDGFATSTSVNGADMAGMLVTARYADGSTEALSWEKTGRWDGGVTGSGFSMTFGSGSYLLSATQKITSLVLETANSLSVFDMLTGKGDIPTNTLGTKHGYGYETTGGDQLDGDIAVTYSDGLYLFGHQRAADTFTKMTVDYTGLFGGGLLGSTEFRTDLDNLAVNDLSSIPLPAGAPLLLAGLAGFSMVRRKRH